MREYSVNPNIREMWRKYPVRLWGLSNSSCCDLPTVLVQSMDGGFVTRNCPKCGEKELLPEVDFKSLGLWVACPECKKPMVAGRLPLSNYGYICEDCDLGIKLADLLPRWTDL